VADGDKGALETAVEKMASAEKAVSADAKAVRADTIDVKVDARSVKKDVATAEEHKLAAEAAATSAARSAAQRPWALVVTSVLTGMSLLAAFGVAAKLIFSSAPQEVTHRIELSTLVCFLGMAFACLGFGLFLIGATGAFKGSTTGKQSAINVETAAPGLVVMVCATIVIYLALDSIKPPAPVAVAPAAATEAKATVPGDAGALDATGDATIDGPPVVDAAAGQ
jgi:hypothetical protein